MYGYGGPDSKHAFYIDGVDTPAMTKKGAITIATERKIEIKDGYPVDMGKLFRSWFLWGFWGSIVQILIICVFVPVYVLLKAPLRTKTIVFIGVQSVQCINTVLWFCLGFFWRFSSGGRGVSGEMLERAAGDSDEEWKAQLENAHKSDGYQFSSGTFMSVYLWIVITLILIGTISLGCYGGKVWMDEQKRKQEEELPDDVLERQQERERRQQNQGYQEVPLSEAR